MGVTIHYNGKIKSLDKINPLIDELTDIAHSLEWEYTVISRYGDPDEELFGLLLSPPDCEPIHMTFMEDRRLIPVLFLAYDDKWREDNLAKEKVWAWTKTQFAGPDIHISVIKLLRYLSEKYLEDFECHDEAEYWETEDRKTVEEKMNLINRGIAALTEGLKNADLDGDVSSDDIVSAIDRILRERLDDIMGEEEEE